PLAVSGLLCQLVEPTWAEALVVQEQSALRQRRSKTKQPGQQQFSSSFLSSSYKRQSICGWSLGRRWLLRRRTGRPAWHLGSFDHADSTVRLHESLVGYATDVRLSNLVDAVQLLEEFAPVAVASLHGSQRS